MYGFGGQSGGVLATCEKYNLETQTWTAITNMISARHSFNACEYRRQIYLCGGSTIGAEVFSPADETFTALNFKLPESTDAATFVYEGELLILTNSCITKYNLVTKQTTQITSLVGRVVIRCNPVIIDNIAFIIHTPGYGGVDGVRQLDLKEFAFKDNVLLSQ